MEVWLNLMIIFEFLLFKNAVLEEEHKKNVIDDIWKMIIKCAVTTKFTLINILTDMYFKSLNPLTLIPEFIILFQNNSKEMGKKTYHHIFTNL